MAAILNIDTSTEICSVALAVDGKLLHVREDLEGMKHSLLLGIFTDEVLRDAGLEAEDLDAVAVSMGPGSYTGLRIGVSLAKGLCFGANLPLIAVGTLQAMADRVSRETGEEALYCPMIDARRMEVYTALYDHSGLTVREVHAEVIGENAFEELLEQHKVYFFGNGSDKARGLIKHSHAVFMGGVTTSAVNMIPLSEEKYLGKVFEDVAYFEPFYLKDFVTTTPRKKVL